jgi:hypothetical protein
MALAANQQPVMKKNGYKRVAEIPIYYVTGEGRIDYFKEFNSQ